MAFLLLNPGSVTMGQRKEGKIDLNEVKCDLKKKKARDVRVNPEPTNQIWLRLHTAHVCCGALHNQEHLAPFCIPTTANSCVIYTNSGQVDAAYACIHKELKCHVWQDTQIRPDVRARPSNNVNSLKMSDWLSKCWFSQNCSSACRLSSLQNVLHSKGYKKPSN